MDVKASYSTVSQSDLASKLAPLYEFNEVKTCQFWVRGVNDTYKLVCADNTYSLRVYRHGLRTRDAIEFEVAALNHLHKRGVSVAHPIAKKDGSYITELQAPEGLRYALVTAYAHGAGPDYKDLANAGLYGEAVAQLHNSSDDFQTDYRRPRLEVEYLLDTSLEVVTPFLSDSSDDLAYLNNIAATLRENVAEVPSENLDIGFCHGDCHGGNVHKHNDILTHYDFDCCGMGLRVFDLATFKWGALNNENSDELWSAFFTAYKGIREVSEAESNLINTFIAIRHIWWVALICGNAQDFGLAGSGDRFAKRQVQFMKSYLE